MSATDGANVSRWAQNQQTVTVATRVATTKSFTYLQHQSTVPIQVSLTHLNGQNLWKRKSPVAHWCWLVKCIKYGEMTVTYATQQLMIKLTGKHVDCGENTFSIQVLVRVCH